MKLVINGDERDLPGSSGNSLTLAALVETLGMKPDRVAIELNRDIVPRERWAATNLKDGDRLEDLHAAMKWIRHVHVADVDGRVFPGESGKSDYRAFFNVLKKSNYEGVISVEAPDATDYKNAPARVIDFLNQQWQKA